MSQQTGESIVVLATCVTLVLGIISFACQIYVSRQLSKTDVKVGLPIGRRSWIAPFVIGWRYAKQLDIVDVMVFWSVILGMAFIGIIVAVLALLIIGPSS